MTIAGTIYGVVLNDGREREALAAAFGDAPYKAPPEAPVVYIKPRLCATTAGAPVPLPEDTDALQVSATVALLFARDVCRTDAADALKGVAAACLALDVSVPEASYYRPAVAQRCRDGFLPVGRFADVPATWAEVTTLIDGERAHSWSLDRLVRPAAQLIADLSQFMTLKAGDVLLVGLPGDAPTARAGQRIRVEGAGLPPLETIIAEGGK